MLEFFSQFPIYAVLVIVLICWIGIFAYLHILKGKIDRFEKRLI